MTEALQRWDVIENPRGYTRRAAISNLIKNKQRGLPRIRERLSRAALFRLTMTWIRSVGLGAAGVGDVALELAASCPAGGRGLHGGHVHAEGDRAAIREDPGGGPREPVRGRKRLMSASRRPTTGRRRNDTKGGEQ